MIYTQYSRIKHHTITTDSSFNVPTGEDFTDPANGWDSATLAKSEIGVNTFDKNVFVRTDDEIKEVQTNYFYREITLPSNGVNTVYTFDASNFSLANFEITAIGYVAGEGFTGKYSTAFKLDTSSPGGFSEIGTATIDEKSTNQNYFNTSLGVITCSASGTDIEVKIHEKSPDTTKWTVRINILSLV